MSTSDDFQDAVAARRDRRGSDEALLSKWVSGHAPLSGLMDNLDGLKGKGFSFEVTSGFRPVADEDPASEYVAPSMTKMVEFTLGKAVAATATLTLDTDGKYTFTADGTEPVKGTSKAALYKALNAWVSTLHTTNPSLNIEGHLLRAQSKPAKKAADPKPSKAA